MTGIAPALLMLVKVLLCRLSEAKPTSLSQPLSFLCRSLTRQRINAISEQLPSRPSPLPRLLQREVRCRAEAHPALAATQFVSENPGLRASVSDLKQQSLHQTAAVAPWFLGPLHLL